MKPDLLVASTPRSGSTVFAGMLNCHDQVCLYEPGANFSRLSAKAKHLKPLGLPNDPNSIVEALRSKRWAVKEVNGPQINRWDALQIIRVVREPDQILLSCKRAFPRSNSATIHWWWSSFLAMKNKEGPIVHYEQFVADPEYRDEFAKQTGWRLEGDPTLFLRSEQRMAEHERHGNRLCLTKNVPQTKEELRLLKDASDKMREYRRFFSL